MIVFPNLDVTQLTKVRAMSGNTRDLGSPKNVRGEFLERLRTRRIIPRSVPAMPNPNNFHPVLRENFRSGRTYGGFVSISARFKGTTQKTP
jgi:hypothetical protein